MKRFVCNYPGDASAEVLEMSFDEFLATCPRRPIQTSAGATPMAPYEVLCDSCNDRYDDPSGLEKFYLFAKCYGYCAKCFRQRFAEHCAEVQ